MFIFSELLCLVPEQSYMNIQRILTLTAICQKFYKYILYIFMCCDKKILRIEN